MREPRLEPKEEPFPICPICGEETDTFIRDYRGEIVGCDHCTSSIDAWDYIANDEY